MPKADEPAQPKRHVQPHPGNGENHRAGGQRDGKRLVCDMRPQRHGQQQQHKRRVQEGFTPHVVRAPNKPCGRNSKTPAIRIYIAIDASEAPTVVAADGSITRPNRTGSKERPSVSVRPTRIAPINAPLIEPIPPITITTKARIRTGSPMPTCTVWIAPISAPANPASAAPSAKTSV